MKKFIRLSAVATIIASLALAACGVLPQDEEVQSGTGGLTRPADTLADETEDSTGYDFNFGDEWFVENQFATFSGTVKEIYQNYQFIPDEEGMIAVSPDTPGTTVAVEGSYFVWVENEAGQTVVFRTDENSVILVENLEVGAVVTGVYNTMMPMIMIYPPQHHAVALIDGLGGVAAGNLEESYTNLLWMNLGDLHISINNNTEIIFQDGTPFDGDNSELIGRNAIAFYGLVAQSLPAQAGADKIVVLFEMAVPPMHYFTDDELAEMGIIGLEPGVGGTDYGFAGIEGGYVEAVPPLLMLSPEDIHTMWVNMFDVNGEVIVNGEAVEMPAPYINEAGFLMVPVAYIAEALGYAVVGEGADVVVGMGMIFTVGEDSYFVGRMAPQQLGAAPELNNGVLFVPLNFFTTMINANVFVDGNIAIDVPAEITE